MATLGGWEDVDIKKNSFEINRLACFAIDEHNKKEPECRWLRVVAGFRYDITFEATDGGVKKVYEAMVWDKPGKDPNELEEFKLIRDCPAKASA
ncbi:hypothetical protein NL676_039333 [Syzygium grande]|nr:hypothetical protein NL676_039333 [Syzygium grande]